MERKERINREIRVPKVQVISSEGKNLGIMDTRDAFQMAQEQGLDLVEINANGRPPIVKILDYGKTQYKKSKEEKKSTQKGPDLKVVKISYNISDADLERKATEAREFLVDGCIVNINLQMKGKENAHSDVGMDKMIRLLSAIGDCAKDVKTLVRHEGRNLNSQVNSSMYVNLKNKE
jgi:translation initiation factor IF-3